MSNTKKVLVVDDTAFMRKAITQLLELDPDLKVVGVARDGLEALKKVKYLKPDVVTLDIDMPIMDGLTAIRHIMIERPVAIVALSSLFRDGWVTFEALRLGVMDFVPKPSGSLSLDIDKSRKHIIDRVKMACYMNLENVRRVRLPKKWSIEKRLDRLYRYYPLEYIVVIGTTLSGPNTVIRLLSKLSPTIPAAVIVLKEISPKIISAFVEQFNEHVPWKVAVAENGAPVEQGTCYLCSNEFSLTLEMNDRHEISLSTGPRVPHPLDQLFASAAGIFQQHTIGILLSGIGDDGAKGFARIREGKGMTIVQDTRCCVFPNLTDNAIQQGVVNLVADERKLPQIIESLMT
jgi:two-component system chemotaxis response regulator CheB